MGVRSRDGKAGGGDGGGVFGGGVVVLSEGGFGERNGVRRAERNGFGDKLVGADKNALQAKLEHYNT